MSPHGTVGFELRELSIMISRYIESENLDRGIDRIHGLQAWAIGYLFENRDKKIFQRDIELEFSIRKPTASNLVKRMVNNGLVTTVTGNEEDKRLKQIVLTEKALAHMQSVDEFSGKLEQQLRKGIDDEEIQQFLGTLKKIKSNVKK